MATKIFISYRRDDAKYEARDIYKALRGVMPDENVFMDVDSIPLGANFRHILNGWVDQCDILLALIGPDWLDAGDASSGQRRLDSPNDFVRIEISEALKRGIPVVPVLLDGASLPDAVRLPDDLKELVDRQAHFIAFRTIDEDVARLIAKLGLSDDGQDGQAVASPTPPQPSTLEQSTSAREAGPSPAPAAAPRTKPRQTPVVAAPVQPASVSPSTSAKSTPNKVIKWKLIAVLWLVCALVGSVMMGVLLAGLNWSFLGSGPSADVGSGFIVGIALNLASSAWILRARGAGASGTEWVIYWLGNSIIGCYAMVILFDSLNWSFQGRGANAGPSGFIVGVTLSLAVGGYLIWRWRNREQK